MNEAQQVFKNITVQMYLLWEFISSSVNHEGTFSFVLELALDLSPYPNINSKILLGHVDVCMIFKYVTTIVHL
jgi:hypothetical protein